MLGASQNASGGVSRRFKPEVPFITPPHTTDWKPPKRPKSSNKKPRTWAIFSDIHCPDHDEELLGKTCEYLRREQPTDGIINGDLVNFDAVSKYKQKPDQIEAINDCLRSAVYWLKSITEASPKTRWTFQPGNHENRLNDYIIREAPALWGVRPGGDEAFHRWHDLRNLLLLDAMGIDLHPALYPDAETAITPKFVVTHGDHTKAKSGNSAHAALDKCDHSFAQGHDHRLALVFKTKWGSGGKPSVHLGVQSGFMARLDSTGLGYAKKPDWQQGFAVVTTWPDDLFSAELAVFVEGALLIGGRRY